MEKKKPWADIGIADETRFLDLYFDPHSQSLIAKLGRLVSENSGVKSLYLRSVHETTYRRLSAKNGTLSFENVVIVPNGPYVYANVLEITVESSGVSGDWHSLQKIELPSGKILAEIGRGELEPKQAGCRTWISSLAGVSRDGQTVFCNLAIQKDGGRVHYHLANVLPTQKRYELVTELTCAFL